MLAWGSGSLSLRDKNRQNKASPTTSKSQFLATRPKHMSTILPRIPEIDWSRDFEPYWCNGNRTITHWFNAVSFMLPAGEQYFHETAREVAKDLDLSNNPQLAQEVRDFTVQESLHAAQHRHYNEGLAKQGFDNIVEPSILWMIKLGRRFLSPLTNLAAVCAYEHYTAILAEHMLKSESKWMKTAPDMALFWGWHAAEETEHKAVCFDLYVAAGGGWLRRASMFVAVSFTFYFLFFMPAYLYLLRKDRQLRPQTRPQKRGSTVSLKNVAFALRGPVGFAFGAVMDYLRPGFHPWQRDNRARMEEWLRDNEVRLRLICSSVRKPGSNAA